MDAIINVDNGTPAPTIVIDSSEATTSTELQLRRSGRTRTAVLPPITTDDTRVDIARRPWVNAETKKWQGSIWETDRIASFATMLMLETGAEELAWLRSGGLAEQWINNPMTASINEEALKVVAEREREYEERMEAATTLTTLKYGRWSLGAVIAAENNAAVALMGLGASSGPMSYTGHALPEVARPTSGRRLNSTGAGLQLTPYITERAAGKAPAVEYARIASTSKRAVPWGLHKNGSTIFSHVVPTTAPDTTPSVNVMRKLLNITRPRHSNKSQDPNHAQAGKTIVSKPIISRQSRPRRFAKTLISAASQDKKPPAAQETDSVEHTSPGSTDTASETPLPRRARLKRKRVILSSEDEAATPVINKESSPSRAPSIKKRVTRSNKLASIEEEADEISSDDVPLVKRQKKTTIAPASEGRRGTIAETSSKRVTRATTSSRLQQVDDALDNPSSQTALRKRKTAVNQHRDDDVSSDDIPLVKRSRRSSVAALNTPDHVSRRPQRARKSVIVEETEDGVYITSPPVKRSTRSQKTKGTTAKKTSKLASIEEEEAEDEEEEEDDSTSSKSGKSKKILVDRPAHLPNSAPTTDTNIPAGALSLNQHFKKNVPAPLGVQLPIDAASTQWEYLVYASRKFDINNFDWANDDHRHAANKWRQQLIRRRLRNHGFKHDGRTNRDD
ncbi:hypothetical protein E4T39_03615 [Aureobasidium subglaciale]|nr:hypothetical protein E4T39_03615 [Aureobasidium subglaciale]